MIYLVTIQDKQLCGEPTIALSVVDVVDEAAALSTALPTLDALAERGCARCVPWVQALEPGKFYRLGAVLRLQRDPNMEDRP
jgi:hypothetical protein